MCISVQCALVLVCWTNQVSIAPSLRVAASYRTRWQIRRFLHHTNFRYSGGLEARILMKKEAPVFQLFQILVRTSAVLRWV